ncbi:MAG TPA: vWA domain-containing protein [Myxococcales bacterium]|jgi:hypothetical protein
MSPLSIRRPLFAPALTLGLLLSCFTSGCDCDTSTGNSHENHTVDVPITGTQLKPYVMLLVDKSGSMLDPAECAPGNKCTRCDDPATAHYDPASPNPCKWNDLKAALASKDAANPGFLVAGKDLAAYGLSVFPGGFPRGEACETGQTLVGLAPDADHVDHVISQLDEVSPGGGTSTTATLELVAKNPRLATAEPGRLRFVMLLTDGEPNCSQSPTNQERCRSCTETHECEGLGKCNPTFGSSVSCEAGLGSGTACFDDSGLIEQITALHASGVDTFIIWFGSASAQPLAAQVLDQAAEAGGRPRQGAATKYWDAASRAELRALLADISKSLQTCTFTLDPAPTDTDILEVVFVDKTNGDSETSLDKDTEFKLGANGTVEILGARCAQIRDAPPGSLNVVFRYVN